MQEDFEYSGVFWAPEQPQKRIPGRLSYTPGGDFELHIIGESSLQDDLAQMNHALETCPVWHGAIIGKGQVTLYQLKHIGTNLAPGLLGMQSIEEYRQTVAHIRYAADFLIWGTLITDWEQPFFDHLLLHPTDIEFWDNRFRYLAGENAVNKTQSVEIQKDYEPIVAQITSLNARLEVEPVAWFQRHHPRSKKSSREPDNSLYHQSLMRLIPDSPQNMDWYLARVDQILRFLALCLNRKVFIHQIFGVVSSDSGRNQNLEIMFRQPRLPEAESGFPNRLYLSLSDFEEEFSDVLERYFETHTQDYAPIYELFIASHYFQDTSIYNQFLNLCQSLESFHRLKTQNKKNVFVERLKDSMDEVDTDFLWIKDLDYFCDVVRDTRNYYTHYDKKRKCLDSANAIYLVNIQLKQALALLLFKHLGVPQEVIKANIKESRVLEALLYNQNLLIRKPETESL